jgi:hypothetical protein
MEHHHHHHHHHHVFDVGLATADYSSIALTQYGLPLEE